MSSAQDALGTNAAKESTSPRVSGSRNSAREIQKQYAHMRPSDPAHESQPNFMLGNDDEPMVYKTPRDYATSARRERDWLISMGADPNSVILQSEIGNAIPRREGETGADYTNRYVETFNGIIRDGTLILNDQTTADVVASRFGAHDGKTFDLGPGSGATKGDFRAFSEWFGQVSEAGVPYEVPERWSRFEGLARQGDRG